MQGSDVHQGLTQSCHGRPRPRQGISRDPRNKCAFSVDTGERVYKLMAETENDADEWVELLQVGALAVQARGLVTSPLNWRHRRTAARFRNPSRWRVGRRAPHRVIVPS
eukprot:SAG11_NODE_6725_length_1259_cov_0.868103_1_plen_109_part_00